MSDFNVGSFFITIGFYFIWIIFVLLIWNFIWLKPFPLILPNPQLGNPSIEISNIFQGFGYIYSLLFGNFSSEFWIQNCGFEAFSYIAFLRKMLSLVSIFFLLSFLFGLPYTLGYSGGDILNSFNLGDDIYKLYFQMFFLLAFSSMYFHSLKSLKQFLFSTYHDYKTKNSHIFKLQDKTLRLKGLLKLYDTELLREKLREVLPQNEKGSIAQCLIIPNTSNLLDLECERQALILKKTYIVLKAEDVGKILNLEKDIASLKERGFTSSGNAIICVKSHEAYEFLLERFTMLRLPFWKNFYLKLKLKISKCCNCVEYCSDQGIHQALLGKEEHEGILAYPLPNPEDISWRNLKKDDTTSSFKRVCWNLLAIVFMIFFTTPASLITVFGLTEIITAINESDTRNPGVFSNVFEKNLSALLILLINQLLVYIINSLARMRRHIQVSKTQIAIFNYCFIYMLFNSFIIPALSMTTVESIFAFLSEESGKVQNLLETFYFHNTGSLFVILLIQSGTFSFTFYILGISDLFLNFFNRKMMNTWRENRLSQEVWMKDETDNFQYGYFYANTVIFLVIILVFSTTVPAISISGMFYFFFKLVCDAWTLVSRHRKELESNGILISRVIWRCCLGGIFFEILMILYYVAGNWKYNIIIMVLVFMVSCFMIWRIEQIKIKKVESYNNGGDEIEEELDWIKKYSHPLVEVIPEKKENL